MHCALCIVHYKKMTSAKQIYKTLLTDLETSMSAVDFDVWIKTLEPVGIKEGKLVLCASSDRMKDFVNEKFNGTLLASLAKTNPLVLGITLIAPSEKLSFLNEEPEIKKQEHSSSKSAVPATDNIEKEKLDKPPEIKSEPPRCDMTPINPKFNFEEFVEGKSNQYMCAAAMAVAENPGRSYNPLFIYGGTGLGKTHIMHAIANSVFVNHPHKRVMYVSSENFLNDFVELVRKGRAKEFRDKYRSVDILMIDDIQFISGKPGVQEEIFHTFNALHGAGKQLVFSSDRPVREIRDLEERLQSRFESGLMVDVQLPDVETRTAILQKKAFGLNVIIDPAVLFFMAEKVSSNIRELEGLLNRVMFLSRLNDEAPTVVLVKEALDGASERSEEAVSSDKVIECVSRYYNISKDDLIGKKKNRDIAEPRQICMYLVNEIVGLPLAKVGENFGGRDHTTVMHARKKVLELIQTNVKVKLAVNDIKEMVFKQGV